MAKSKEKGIILVAGFLLFLLIFLLLQSGGAPSQYLGSWKYSGKMSIEFEDGERKTKYQKNISSMKGLHNDELVRKTLMTTLRIEKGQYGDGPQREIKLRNGATAVLKLPVKITTVGSVQYGGIYDADGTPLLIFWYGISDGGMNVFFVLRKTADGLELGSFLGFMGSGWHWSKEHDKKEIGFWYIFVSDE